MEAVKVYVRNENVDESEHDDVWDDELLIKAYNKSVKGIKQQIAQRLGEVNGLCENRKGEGMDKSSVKNDKNSGLRKGQNKKKWEIGDYCRAIYSEDGLEYEAQILDIRSDGQYLVKYSGYDNEELVKVRNLKKTLGADSRATQRLVASGQTVNNKSHGLKDLNDKSSSNAMPSLAGIPAVPPPPAFSLTSQFHQENESDALSAMLMSWYMSGYHTGYYQGLMHAKQNQNSSDKK